jgi:hypothetical protein
VAQEEVILYNSDGYRALLDLKYGRMGGGYAIPEFGLAYVRNICFFDSKSDRQTDMLVSACYCLNGAELYDNPVNEEQVTTKMLFTHLLTYYYFELFINMNSILVERKQFGEISCIYGSSCCKYRR